ncbi:MAG: hypothetical protein KAT52_06515, partial [Desulfobacterales bacterium]|nr:hypothetical protein [Desulfobacterales bacterium]
HKSVHVYKTFQPRPLRQFYQEEYHVDGDEGIVDYGIGFGGDCVADGYHLLFLKKIIDKPKSLS